LFYFFFKREVLSKCSILNPLKAELNPTCHLLALLGAHTILHISRIRAKSIVYVVAVNDVAELQWG
jgi:hypothetical protein